MDERDLTIPGMPVWAVAVYDTERLYGGPEEGGWWYTYGELHHVEGWFTGEDDALDCARALNDDELTWPDRSRVSAEVVQVPRWELKREYADAYCHNWDIELEPQDFELRWDVRAFWPERRPHYC